MRNLIKQFLFLFYKYYDKGSTKDIAYESAVLAFIGFTTLNFVAIFIFFDIDIFVIIKSNYPKYVKYLLCFIVYLLPAYFLIRRYYPKEVITSCNMDKFAMRKGYFFIIVYIIISIAILILSVEYK